MDGVGISRRHAESQNVRKSFSAVAISARGKPIATRLRCKSPPSTIGKLALAVIKVNAKSNGSLAYKVSTMARRQFISSHAACGR